MRPSIKSGLQPVPGGPAGTEPESRCVQRSNLAQRITLAGVPLPTQLSWDNTLLRAVALVSPLVGLAGVEPSPREDLAAQGPDARCSVGLYAMSLAAVLECGRKLLPRMGVFILALQESVWWQVLLECDLQRYRSVIEGRESRDRGDETGSQGWNESGRVKSSRQNMPATPPTPIPGVGVGVGLELPRGVSVFAGCSVASTMVAAPTSAEGAVVPLLVVGRVPV